MKIIAGAGFIGSNATSRKLSSGHHIVGVLEHHRWTTQRSQCLELDGRKRHTPQLGWYKSAICETAARASRPKQPQHHRSAGLAARYETQTLDMPLNQ